MVDHHIIQSSINRKRRKELLDNKRCKKQSVVKESESLVRHKRYLILRQKKEAKHQRMENYETHQGVISESSISDVNFADRYVIDQDNNGESSCANDSVISKNINSEIWNFKRPTFKCRHCNALLWYEERIRPNTHTKNPSFGICCENRKIKLPVRPAPPAFVQEIYSNYIDITH
jgi:hypothetical protein